MAPSPKPDRTALRMKAGFRLPPMPIAGHVMLLVVGVLIAAQGATLVLTLTFPPQPPAQHSLEDIAKAMRGQAVQAHDARPLLRQVAYHRPRAEGPGWLSAVGPRDRLAALLDADPSDVILMFYVPLPAGAQPMRQSPPADQPGPHTAPQAAPSRSAPSTIAVASLLPVDVAAPLLIRARQMGAPAAPFLGRPGPGLPPGAFPRDGFNPGPRGETPDGFSTHVAVDRASGGARTPPWTGAQNRLARPTPSRLNLATPAAVDPLRPSGQTGDGASLPPGGIGMGRALAAALAARRRGAAPVYGAMTTAGLSTTVSASSIASDAPWPSMTKSPPAAPSEPTSAPSPAAPAPSRADAQAPASERPLAQGRPGSADAEDADLEPTADASSAPAAVRRGLFAPAVAGYVEGDFIAAQRVGDRWIVVRPRPEGFPNAWQSRVMLWFALSFTLVAPWVGCSPAGWPPPCAASPTPPST